MSIETLTAQWMPEVKQFCVEHLAGILYKCVDHAPPRWDVDGNTARDFIDKNGSNLSVISGMTTKFLVTSAYQEVRKTKPHMPELNLKSVVYGGLLSQEVLNVHQRLMFLTDDEFSGLVTSVPQCERRYEQDQFLGRDVWEFFYQTIKRDRDFLDARGYGMIKFH